MRYIGRYINMDGSTERRRVLTESLAAFGCAERYQRFSGVDGRSADRGASPLKPGEYGCFMSHYRCIQESMSADEHLHVVEDDVVFGPRTVPILDQAMGDGLGQCEMVFTDIFVPADLPFLIDLMALYRRSGVLEGAPGVVNFRSLADAPFAGSSSYFLRADARAKMLGLMEAEIAAGPTIPVDTFFAKIAHAGQIVMACTAPFLTSVDAAAVLSTTIDGRAQHDHSALAFYLLRNYFFVDKDDAALDRLGRELTDALSQTRDVDTLVDLLRFITSDRLVAD